MSDWKLNRLRVLRSERRLTQHVIAQRLGMSQSMYWQIETAVREPDADTRDRIARVFDVAVDELIQDEAKAS